MSYLSSLGSEYIQGLQAALSAASRPNIVTGYTPQPKNADITQVTRMMTRPTRATTPKARLSSSTPLRIRRLWNPGAGISSSPSSFRTVSLASRISSSLSPIRSALIASRPLAAAARVGGSIVSSLSGLATAASPWVGTVLLALAAAAAVAALAYGIYLVTTTTRPGVKKVVSTDTEQPPISGNELLSYLPPYARSSIRIFRDPAVIGNLRKLFLS